MKAKLDQFVLDIEFLLISVVQGVALAALATSAASPLTSFKLEFWPYVFSAFLFILIFWSGAIIHSLSFIDWPLDLLHNFLYFLLAFIEVLAFSQITNPLYWFGFISLFFGIAFVLYAVDLNLINNHEKAFQSSEQRKKLFKHIKSEQILEMKFLLPLGFIFNLFSFWLIFSNTFQFINNGQHLYLGIIQLLFLIVFLINATLSFKKRAKLISESIY